MTEERDNEVIAHLNTITLLRQLKAGDVFLERVIMTDNGWRLEPAGNEPKEGSVG